jgi:hypothetical protein
VKRIFVDRQGYFYVGWIVASIVVGVCVVTLVVVGGIMRMTRYYDARQCDTYAEQTDRETRFVDWSWQSWDCLTPSGDGHWIPIEQLRKVEQ